MVRHSNAHSLPRDLAELTVRGVILGALITVIFTASNVYLGLKVGLTFSSAIPSAIISMAILKAFSGANILENNMVQTQASAAGTLSSVIFVIPGLLMIGHWHHFPYLETFGICAAGGLLGVIFTIPLRHAMVVESDLPYPEGVAAAEILRVGDPDHAGYAPDKASHASDTPRAPDMPAQAAVDASPSASERGAVRNTEPAAARALDQAQTGAIDITLGGIVSAAVAFATSGLRVLSDGASIWFSAGAAIVRLPMGFSLALLGAGYLIGIVAGIATLVGLIIAWGIAVPILTAARTIPAGQSMTAFATSIWQHDVRFIGAGVIGVAAVWTLLTLLGPVSRGMLKAFGSGRARSGRGRRGGGSDGGGDRSLPDARPRTERDLPAKWIFAVMVLVVALLAATFSSFLSDVPQTAGQRWTLIAYGVLFAFIFGFLISAACGYMAGLIGSSSSPISGIAIIGTILISGLLLLTGGQTGLLATPEGTKLATAFALFATSAVIAVAAIANDNLQDLKTGWLVGATPWRQQVALLIGVVVGAAVIPPILDLLYQAFGFTGAMPREGMDPGQALSAPQATLMASIANGIFTHQLNWTMLKIGALTGVGLICIDLALQRRGGVARLPVLAVGIGIYLPPVVSMPLAIGAFLSWGVERMLRRRAARAGVPYARFADEPNRRAVLLASGLIVGESLFGVFMAGVIGFSGNDAPFAVVGKSFASTSDLLALIVFVGICVVFARRVMRTAA